MVGNGGKEKGSKQPFYSGLHAHAHTRMRPRIVMVASPLLDMLNYFSYLDQGLQLGSIQQPIL